MLENEYQQVRTDLVQIMVVKSVERPFYPSSIRCLNVINVQHLQLQHLNNLVRQDILCTMFCSAMKHSMYRSGKAFLKMSEKVEFLVSPSRATTLLLAWPSLASATPYARLVAI